MNNKRITYELEFQGLWYFPSSKKWRELQEHETKSFQNVKHIRTFAKAVKEVNRVNDAKFTLRRLMHTKKKHFILDEWTNNF